MYSLCSVAMPLCDFVRTNHIRIQYYIIYPPRRSQHDNIHHIIHVLETAVLSDRCLRKLVGNFISSAKTALRQKTAAISVRKPVSVSKTHNLTFIRDKVLQMEVNYIKETTLYTLL